MTMSTFRAPGVRLPLFLAMILAGCGGGGGGTSTSVAPTNDAPTAVATPIVTATPSPSATTPPTDTMAGMSMPTGISVAAPALAGLPEVKSGIDVQSYLDKAWGNGAIPASGKPDVVGAFRFLCAPSHNAYDDPIVYPGQPGKAHLHTFFGNMSADANSNYESLRKSGKGSCNNLLNRSAYWIPAMINGRDKVVMPDFISIYYKRRPSSDPECRHQGKACVALPRGLRYIFGYNMADPAKSDHFQFGCDGTGAVAGSFKNIPQAAKGCPVGAKLGASITAPSCWNGTELDSPDHRSHMAYPSYGDWGYEKCPATHPYIIPTFTLSAWYTTDATLDRSGNESVDATWYFSSDRMAGMARAVPGTTFHADWFGAWEDSIMEAWTANCIEKLLNCSGGDLGNGWQLKTLAGYDFPAAGVSRLVDIPKRP